MAEAPDFDQIARLLADETGVGRLEEWDRDDPTRVVTAVAEQLRLAWNARGAADIAKAEAVLLEDGDDSQMNALDRALRSLDR